MRTPVDVLPYAWQAIAAMVFVNREEHRRMIQFYVFLYDVRLWCWPVASRKMPFWCFRRGSALTEHPSERSILAHIETFFHQ